MFVELHAVGNLGANGLGLGENQNVPKWRKTLEDAVRAKSLVYTKALHELHDREKSQNQRCHRCRQVKYRLDFCEFFCTPDKRENRSPFKPRLHSDNTPHRFCQDCVATMIRNQVRNKLITDPELLETLGTSALFLIPCPLCRSPNVLTSETRFHEGFERQNCTKNGVMKNFSVHQTATRLVSENYVVEECYENQRRPPFGVFTKENLLEVDWCGPFSTRGMTCIEEIDQYFAPPNKSWKWLEQWEPDVTVGGAFGWMYARRWPSKEDGWESVISLFHLVRRRRLLRTRVRFDSSVRDELRAINEELSSKSNVLQTASVHLS